MPGLGCPRAYSSNKGTDRRNHGEAQGLFLGLHESVWRWNLGGSRFPADICKNQEFPGAIAIHVLYSAGNVLRKFSAHVPPPSREFGRAGRLGC